MREVVIGVVVHSQLFHHTSGSGVSHRGKADNLLQPKLAETKTHSFPCTFGSVASVPVLRCQPPTHFDTWGEVCFITRHAQPNESSERGDTRDLHGPEAEASFAEVGHDAIHHGIAGFTRQPSGEILHHQRVGIESSKWSAISLTPGAEEETWCGELRM